MAEFDFEYNNYFLINGTIPHYKIHTYTFNTKYTVEVECVLIKNK